MANDLYFFDERVQMADITSGDVYRQQLEQMQQRVQAQGITAEQVQQYQSQGPNGSPGLLASMLGTGAPAEQYGQLAASDPGHDSFQWYDPRDWVSEAIEAGTTGLTNTGSFLYEQVLKPLVRGAFVITEGLSQEAVQRPLSAVLAAADQEMSVSEAYNQYGTSALFQALGNVVGEETEEEVGKGFDLGTGFFSGGSAQLQAEEARRLMVQGQKANLGRLMLDPQMRLIGQAPGDRVYDISTGILQFAMDVLTDPSILLTAGTGSIAKVAGGVAGRGSRLLGMTDEVVDAGRIISRHQQIQEGVAKALTIDGIVPRARASMRFGQVQEEASSTAIRLRQQLFTPEELDQGAAQGLDEVAQRLSAEVDAGNEEVLRTLREATGLLEGPNGKSAIFDTLTSFVRKDGLLDALAQADEVAIVNGFRPGRGNSVPHDFVAALGRASTKDEVAGILNDAVAVGHVQNRNFYGGFGSLVRKRAPSAVVEKFDKFSGLAARGFLHADDPDLAMAKLDTLARQAGLTRADRNEIIQRVGSMTEGDQAEMFEIAGDVYAKVADRLKDVDPTMSDNFIKDLTSAYNTELENLRAYNVGEVGEHGASVLPQRTVKRFNPDGSYEEVVVPQPHLLSEFNSLSVPIPEIDDIRRAATQSDTMRQVYQSTGWRFTNRSLRFITRQLFKPLVLLRPAYIARTQIDDQMRMAAAGVDGLLRNPRHLVEMATKAPDELMELATRDPSLARHTQRILNQSILDIGGQSVSKPMRERVWTVIRKPFVDEGTADDVVREEMADYITAWRHELGQLANDRIAHHMILNDLDPEATAAAIMGRRLRNPEEVARMERNAQMLGRIEERVGALHFASPEMRDLGLRAQRRYTEDNLPRLIDNHLRNARGARPLDTLVHPGTGRTHHALDDQRFLQQEQDELDELLGMGHIDDAPPPPRERGDDLDPTIPEDDFLPDVDPDEAITLEEYLDDLRADLEASPESIAGVNLVNGEPLLNYQSRLSSLAPEARSQYLIEEILSESGEFDPTEAAALAKKLSEDMAYWASPNTGVEDMHTLREQSELLNLVRQTGAAGRQVFRGERQPIAVFNQALAEGKYEPGQVIRVRRMQSASSNADKAEDFALTPMSESAPNTGEGVQVIYRYSEDVRAQNTEWLNPAEDEWLMPEQHVRIRSVRRVKDDPDAYVPNDEERYIIEVDAVPFEGVTGKVMREGPQPWMHDLNHGAYDGTPQSLAPTAWNDLDPAERAEYEEIHRQIEAWLGGSPDDIASIQYYSELRHLVDNAPKVPDPVYISGDEVGWGSPAAVMASSGDEITAGMTVDDLIGNKGQPLRTDQTRLEGAQIGRGTIPKRMSNGRIDPSEIDSDVVIRLPKGSQALRVGDDYIIPPSRLSVAKVRTQGDKTIVDVTIDHQPGQGVAVWGEGEVEQTLRDTVQRIANSSNPNVARLLEDEDYLRGYLQTVRDRILTKTNGNQEILDALASDARRYTGTDRVPVDITDDAQFEDLLAKHVVEDAPSRLKAQRFPDGRSEDPGALEIMTAIGYEYIVSKPAAYLSRYPAWVEFISRDFADLMPMMRSDQVRREVIDLAEGQLGATSTQLDRLRKAAFEAQGKEGLIGNVDEARRLALAHATESVEELLFDVANKSAFQDAFDVMFPFVDAWREGLQVWGRLMKENPSLFLKGVAALRGAEETGAIYTNERGERMFAMPASGTLGNFVERMNAGQNMLRAAAGSVSDTVRGEIDEDSIGPIQTQMDFRLSGVNLMLNSIGPGFGPVVQWPTGAFLPDTPEFVGLQELINPFGDPFDERGDILNPTAYIESLTPAWAKKVINAWTGGDIDPVQWNSAVHDSLRALEMSGNYDPGSMEDRGRLTEDAERSARWMLMVRGLVHGVGPTSPGTQWRVKTDGVDEDFDPQRDWDPHADPDGVWHEINSLASAYWDLFDQYGDSVIAQQKFMEAYGVTPAYLRTPKSRILSNLPATKEAGFWAEENRAAMEKYPVVSGYFAPPDEGNENFDYRVYLDQFASGQRELITPEQQIALANRSQAQQIYYNTKDHLDALEIGSNERNTILSVVKGRLNEQYPGWEIPVAGVTNIPTDAKIEQLKMAAFDPDLSTSPLTGPLQQYFSVRDQLLGVLRAQTGSPNATLARQDAEASRQALLQIGTLLSSQNPNFRGVWDLLRREVEG